MRTYITFCTLDDERIKEKASIIDKTGIFQNKILHSNKDEPGENWGISNRNRIFSSSSWSILATTD
jgi:hypothetical protein